MERGEFREAGRMIQASQRIEKKLGEAAVGGMLELSCAKFGADGRPVTKGKPLVSASWLELTCVRSKTFNFSGRSS